MLDGRFGSAAASQLAHLGLTDETLQTCNLSPDLVLFADQVMDTLGQLLLVRKKKKRSVVHETSRVKVHQVLTDWALIAHTSSHT